MRVCVCDPTIITGSLLFDCSGHSSCSWFPEWVPPAFSGPLHCQFRVLVAKIDRMKKKHYFIKFKQQTKYATAYK